MLFQPDPPTPSVSAVPTADDNGRNGNGQSSVKIKDMKSGVFDDWRNQVSLFSLTIQSLIYQLFCSTTPTNTHMQWRWRDNRTRRGYHCMHQQRRMGKAVRKSRTRREENLMICATRLAYFLYQFNN